MRTARLALAAAASLFVATGATVTVHAQEVPTATSASALFRRGRDLYDNHEYADALAAFQGSLAAENSPNTLLYIGRCLRGLGRVRDAYVAISRAAADANQRAITEPRFVAAAESARSEAQALVPELAFVTVHIPSPPIGIEVRLNEELLETSAMDQRIPYDPGGILVRARAPHYAPFEQQLHVEAGQATRIEIAMMPTPDAMGRVDVPGAEHRIDVARPGHHRTPVGRTVGLIGMGVGGAVSIFGLVAAGFAESEYQTLVASCGEGRCLPNVTGAAVHRAAGETWQLLANTSIIAGSVVFVAGAIMAIAIRPPSDEASARRSRRIRIAIEPTGGVSVAGEF